MASPLLSDGTTVYTPGISERPVNGATSHYLLDALGSVVATVNGSQQLSSDQRFDAFGNKGWYIPFSSTFGFAAKAQYQTDGESGLLLLGHRYYDPSVGRFISQDPAQDESNWCAYCGNNPLVATDPTGLTINRENWTDEQNEYFDRAVEYLSKDKQMKAIFDFLESEAAGTVEVVLGKNLNYDQNYVDGDMNTRTINWNPKMAAVFSKDETVNGKPGSQSPAMGLGHEAAHLVQKIKRPQEMKHLAAKADIRWKNMEEKRVITGPEWSACKTLGESRRKGYYGFPVLTDDPLSR